MFECVISDTKSMIIFSFSNKKATEKYHFRLLNLYKKT